MFPDEVKTFDGEEYVVKLGWYSILPSGVTIDFECKSNGVSFEYVKGTTTYHTGDFT